MAQTVTLDKILIKDYEEGELVKLAKSPVSALAGVSDSDAVHLKEAFGIKTVQDLGTNKYFQRAAAIAALADLDG